MAAAASELEREVPAVNGATTASSTSADASHAKRCSGRGMSSSNRCSAPVSSSVVPAHMTA
jgi:hypothetical protein